MMKDLPLSDVYGLIEPGPVVLLTTIRQGRANVMTMSWHMMVDFEPPLVACIVSAADFSFKALVETRECVIAIPDLEQAATIVQVGNSTGRDTDKFAAFDLTPLPGRKVEAPLIGQCFANLECKIADDSLVERYNLFILEVVKAWIDPAREQPRTLHHKGYGRFVVDGETIELRSHMR